MDLTQYSTCPEHTELSVVRKLHRKLIDHEFQVVRYLPVEGVLNFAEAKILPIVMERRENSEGRVVEIMVNHASIAGDQSKERLSRLYNLLKDIKGGFNTQETDTLCGLIQIRYVAEAPYKVAYSTCHYNNADLDYAIRNNIAIDVDLLVNDLSAAIASMERIGMVHNAINPQSIVKQPDGRYVLTSFMSAVRSCETEGFSPMITPYASLEMRQAAASGAIFIPSSADDKFAVAATVADILSNCEWFHTDLNLSEFQDNVYALAKFLLVSPKVSSKSCRVLFEYIRIPFQILQQTLVFDSRKSYWNVILLPGFAPNEHCRNIDEVVEFIIRSLLRLRRDYRIIQQPTCDLESVVRQTGRSVPLRCIVEISAAEDFIHDVLRLKMNDLETKHYVSIKCYKADGPIGKTRYSPTDKNVLNIVLKSGANLTLWLFDRKRKYGRSEVQYVAAALFIFRILLNINISKADIVDTFCCLAPEFQMPKMPRTDSDKPFWFGVRLEERSLGKKQEILNAARALNLGQQCHIYIAATE